MKPVSLRKALLTLACLTGLGLTASCSTPAPSPPAPQPAVQATPPQDLSQRIVDSAARYQAYRQKALSIQPDFADGPAIAQSLQTSAHFKGDDLVAGSIAYGAVVALQDPAFVASLRTLAADPAGRRTMTANLARNPSYATMISGADRAAGLVIAALDKDGQSIFERVVKVKQAAYDIQHQAWSKGMVADRPQRLNAVKAAANDMPASDMETFSVLQGAAKGQSTLTVAGEPLQPPYTLVVTRALAVAALAGLGEAGDGADEAAYGLVTAPTGDVCLTMAKLNLYQCLAVAGPHYEDVFCMGQHGIKDTGQCLIRMAGAPVDPAILAARAEAAATARTAAMSVPSLVEAKKSTSKGRSKSSKAR